jgi:hypothetical protein
MQHPLLSAVLCLSASLACAQTSPSPASATKSSIQIERFEGSPVKPTLSTLKREWFVINDHAGPVKIIDIDGIKVEQSKSQYEYKLVLGIEAVQAITALEIRSLVVDVFGKPLRMLSATEVGDLHGKGTHFETWSVWPQSDAHMAYASVTYIAQVRTAAGQVYEIDKAAVLEQIRTIFKRISQSELEPPKEPPSK